MNISVPFLPPSLISSTCPSPQPPTHLSVHPSTFPCVHPPFHLYLSSHCPPIGQLFAHQAICSLSDCLWAHRHAPICLLICPPIPLIHPPTRPLICPSTYHIHPSTCFFISVPACTSTHPSSSHPPTDLSAHLLRPYLHFLLHCAPTCPSIHPPVGSSKSPSSVICQHLLLTC